MASIMNEALSEALQIAAAEGRKLRLPPAVKVVERPPEEDHRLVLAMVRTHRKAHLRGQMTISARERVSGDIILGPYSNRRETPTEEGLDLLMQAHRWVLNPIHMGDGNRRPLYTIVGPPTITLMHRIETHCDETGCGNTDREWKDIVIMRSRDESNPHERVNGWSPDLYTPCKKCGRPVSQRKLWCTAIRSRPDSQDDPVVLEKDAAAVTRTFLEAWKQGPPADGQPTLGLPRIWAVYRKDDVPDQSWQPSDARAAALVEKAATFQKKIENGGVVSYQSYPLGILPYAVAKQFHQAPEPQSKEIREWWLENDTASIGWVRRSDLFPNENMGWRRRLWHDNRQTTELLV
jgi:hypothetical protein